MMNSEEEWDLCCECCGFEWWAIQPDLKPYATWAYIGDGAFIRPFSCDEKECECDCPFCNRYLLLESNIRNDEVPDYIDDPSNEKLVVHLRSILNKVMPPRRQAVNNYINYLEQKEPNNE